MKNNNTINLPKNIKQMGNIDDNFKIYMEDYVFTYLQQYSKYSKGEEQIAILIGDTYIIDGKDVMFINGAIKGEHTINEGGMVKLTKQSFDYIDEQMKRYFADGKIVGWFYSQPGFSDYINEGYISYHKENFTEKNQVFFLSDPLENIGGFYKFHKDDFKSIDGFIIYYEKNEAMSEYMLDNKISQDDNDREKTKVRDERLINISKQRSDMTKKLNNIKEYKKMTNIFGSLSAVLILICFIMGAGLIQSDDKISDLEKRISKLDESYRYILNQVKNENVKSVFAENVVDATESITQQDISHTKNETVLSTTQIIQTEATTESITTIESKTEEKTTKEAIREMYNKEELKKYEVREGDSLETISKKVYGDRSKIDEIMAINEIEDPDKIYIGMILLLP